MLQPYVAVIERNKEGRFFAHLHDLPGATAAGASVGEVLRNLADIAADHLIDLVEEGEDIPEPTEFEDVPRDPDVKEYARAFVSVEAPGRSVKISLSIDEGLLARVDRAAKAAGLTRSGFFAEAAHQRLRQESSPAVGVAPAASGFVGMAQAAVNQLHGGEGYLIQPIVTGSTRKAAGIMEAIGRAKTFFISAADDDNIISGERVLIRNVDVDAAVSRGGARIIERALKPKERAASSGRERHK